MTTPKRSARQSARPAPDEELDESLRRLRDLTTHRIRLGRRIHELLAELDGALSLYSHHALPELEPDLKQFRHELRRIRGGVDVGCPILVETAHSAHVDRAAFAELADRTGLSGSALETSLGRSRGYAAKTKAIKEELPAILSRCERCDKLAAMTAAVGVVDEKTLRRVLEHQALCLDCYDDAIANG